MSSREGSHAGTVERYELSERQREVLGLMADGRTNYEIAQALGLSLEGAKYHVSEILGKLGVDSHEEAVAWWRGDQRLSQRLRRRLRGFWPALGFGAAGAAALGVIGVVLALTLGGDGGSGTSHVWVAVVHQYDTAGAPGRLEVIDATAGTRRDIANATLYGGPLWSPDGSRLAVFAIDDGASLLFFEAGSWRELNATGKLPLLGSGLTSWSPDSRLFAVTGSVTQIYDRDGQLIAETDPIATTAADGSSSSSTGVWTPDSARFAAKINGRLMVIERDGQARELRRPEGPAPDPLRWLDNSTLLAVDVTTPPPGHYLRIVLDAGGNAIWSSADHQDLLSPSPYATVSAMSSATTSRGLLFDGLSDDGEGLVYMATPSGLNERAPVVVISGGVETRVDLGTDVLMQRLNRDFAVVVAPAP